MERRLAAILLTDMVGYSRLMRLDEEGTIARQKAHREKVIDPRISSHGGRIVKTTGDGVLVEFPSVVDAVKCAVELQKEMGGLETDVPEDRLIQYRIGINLGDIVIDGDDILGDGVNVAARLEGLANPGGICISGIVHDQVRAILHCLTSPSTANFEGATLSVSASMMWLRVDTLHIATGEAVDMIRLRPVKRTLVMSAWRKFIERPLAAAIVCSLLVLPARAIGHEAAQAFRRLFNHVVSKSDLLFALATQSKATADAFRSGQAWGAWIVYGFVAGVIAMLVTRKLVGRPLQLSIAAFVLAVWIGVYFLVWNWDGELKFILTNFQVGGPGVISGPWPFGGSVGFFSGLVAGLILAATPWRAGNMAN